MSVCVPTHMCVPMHMCVCTHMGMRVCKCVCLPVNACVCVQVWAHAHVWVPVCGVWGDCVDGVWVCAMCVSVSVCACAVTGEAAWDQPVAEQLVQN